VVTHNDVSIDLQYFAARAAIQDVLARYFHGLDRCDPQEVRSCFTDDVHVDYDERPPVNWSCQMPANYAVGLAQRVSALPDRHSMGVSR
jgi:hypothetical protein